MNCVQKISDDLHVVFPDRDDQGLTIEARQHAQNLADHHWSGYTGPVIKNVLALVLSVDIGGWIQVRKSDFDRLLEDLHRRWALHYFKHGIEYEKFRAAKERADLQAFEAGAQFQAGPKQDSEA